MREIACFQNDIINAYVKVENSGTVIINAILLDVGNVTISNKTSNNSGSNRKSFDEAVMRLRLTQRKSDSY